MQSRILLITPTGPLCYIDYRTVDEGMAVLDALKNAVSISKLTSMIYEFRLMKFMKDRLVSIDRLLLPRFDTRSVDIFLDSCIPAHIL